jgi:hypothetical protein
MNDRRASSDGMAGLVRHVPVRVVEISRGGCRLESGAGVPHGATGTLTVMLKGVERVDDVRIARCLLRKGGATYQVGAELLLTRPLSRESLRLAVSELTGESPAGDGPDVERPGTPPREAAATAGIVLVDRAPPVHPEEEGRVSALRRAAGACAPVRDRRVRRTG